MNDLHIDLIKPKEKRAAAVIAMVLILLAVASYRFLHPAGPPGSVALDKPVATQAPMVFATPSSAPAASPQLSPIPTQSPPALAPVTADQSAMQGMGRLAFTSQDRLYMLDASGIRLLDERALRPSWSPSGRWLAYWGSVGKPPSDQGSFQITDGDSTMQLPLGVFPVMHAGPCGEAYAWSPVQDQLAIALGNALWLQLPGAARRKLMDRCVMSFAWSPDGSRIAFVLRENPDQLMTLSVAGGEQTSLAIGGLDWPLLEVTGWWPDNRGVFYGPDPKLSPSSAADGHHLFSVPLTGGEPTILPKGLAYTSWFANSPDGQRFALVRGSGREVQIDKVTTVCRVPATCTDIALRPNTVLTGPAWSPDGARLAVLEAAAGNPCCSAPYSPEAIAQWNATHRIVITDPNGTVLKYLDWGQGALYLQWSNDARTMLFVRDHAIWKLNLYSGRETRIAGPLTGVNDNYYGWIDWSSLVAWTGG